MKMDSGDQFTALQGVNGGLDRAFGKSGFIGDRSQAGGDWPPACPGGLGIEKKKNQKRCRLTIVAD